MESSTTPTRTLDDRLDSQAEAWKPQSGEKLIGVVVDVDSRTTEFGTYPIVTLSTDAGDEVAVHAFHTVLKNEFAKRQPRLGERIGIKYLGRSEKGYEAYRTVWEEVVPPDWDRIGVEATAEAVVEGIDDGAEGHPSRQRPAPATTTSRSRRRPTRASDGQRQRDQRQDGGRRLPTSAGTHRSARAARSAGRPGWSSPPAVEGAAKLAMRR